MSIQVEDLSEGILTLTVSGTLTESELAAAQQAMAEAMRAHGKLCILVVARGFSGWERGGNWNDFSFQQDYDSSIKKMAFIGDTQWEDLVLMFVGKGLRSFPIEYFEPSALDRARTWLRNP